jgi:HEAT repeat protein
MALCGALPLVIFFALVVFPFCQTRDAVLECSLVTRKRGMWTTVDREVAAGQIERLGGPRRASERLVDYLNSSSPSFAPHRLTAIVMLGECGAEARPVLPELLAIMCSTHRDDDEMRAAARAIAAIDRGRAAAYFSLALRDGNWEVKRLAVYCLESMRGPEVVDVLSSDLDADDAWVRLRAARALGKIGDPRAVDALRLALKTEKDPYVRWDLNDALCKIAVKQASKSLARQD